MKDLRIWILVLAFVSFVAGTAFGKLLSDRSEPAKPSYPLADYESLMVSRFDLDPQRTRFLRGILQSYEREIDRVEENHLVGYRSAMLPELQLLGIEYNRYIRDHVLPSSKRSQFDELSDGLHPKPVGE